VNKSMLMGIAIGGASALSVAAIAGYQALKGPEYAQVLGVEAVKVVQRTPERECRQVPVTRRAPVKDDNRIAGTVVGGVLGGVIGHQFGSGRGQTVATVAGAAGGAYAGNQVQKGMQERDTYTATEERCETVTKTSEKVVGYDVKYLLDGKPGTVRMDREPGERIPVRNGQLVVEAPAGS
jgi:uncharacterized protein YcfJ